MIPVVIFFSLKILNQNDQNLSLIFAVYLEMLWTLSNELKWWTSWCSPYIPFWCTGRPVRMADLLGEQLLTEVKALLKTAEDSANLSRWGVLITGLPRAPIWEIVSEKWKPILMFTSSPASSAMMRRTFLETTELRWQVMMKMRKIVNIIIIMTKLN